jgi:hypothetical protein
MKASQYKVTYRPCFLNGKLRVFSSFVQLQQILPLFRKTTGEEIWKNALDSSKDENVSYRSQRDKENDNERYESDHVLKSSAKCS